MPATPLRRAAILGVLLVLFSVPLFAQDASRLQQVSDELNTLQGVIEKLPENARERKKLEERRSLLERERGILEHRQILDARGAANSRRTQEKPAQRLAAALRDLEVNSTALQARRDKLVETIRTAVARKDALTKERQRLAGIPATPERDARLAAIDEQSITANEEIESLQLQREAVDHRVELTREVETVSTRLKDEPSVPDLHLRSWWERRREITDRLRHQAEVGEANLTVGEKRTAAAESVALAREKLAKIDEEISLLTPQAGLFRGANGTERLLAAAKRDKEAMLARMPFIENQLTALEESQVATTAHVELLRQQIDWLLDRQALFTDRLTRWLGWPSASAVFLVVLFVGISRLILPRLYKQEMLVSARRVNRYMMVVAVAAVLAAFFLEDLRALATTLSIVSAAMVIALQDIFISLAGWVALIASRKLRVGDRVEIDGVKGDVIEIELLRTTILEVDGGLGTDHPSGRVVSIPNNFIFRTRVHNSTHMHRWVWSRTDILVTYETPHLEAAAILERALKEETAEAFTEATRDSATMESRYGRIDAEYRPKFYHQIADSGVNFTMIYVCDYRQKTGTRDRLHRRILADFAKDPRMQFAYPTSRQFQSFEPAPSAAHAPAASANGNGNGTPLTAWPDTPTNGAHPTAPARPN